MNRKDILENYPEEEFLFADGFDAAIIGVEEKTMKIVYSVEKIIESLMLDMTFEEAIEYYDFNIECAYVGEKTPLYIKTNFEF